MEKISRKEAKVKGFKTYFTGKPCKHGHFDSRRTANGSCEECSRKRSLKRYTDKAKNPDFREENRKTRRKYSRNNPEKFSKYAQNYYQKNREKVLNAVKEYQQQNTDKINAYCAKRRAEKVNATPKWANLEVIKEIYKNCPKGMQVDHIVPLKGKNVSGLHVENNLQYLTPKENQSKKNKYV